MLTYHESSWAVRRWNWFNQGRIVEPKSFCQFWRTAVVYASIRWLLTPLALLGSLLAAVPIPRLPFPRVLADVLLLLGAGFWFSVCLGGRVLRLLTLPLRIAVRPIGGAMLTAAVNTGGPIVAFGERHWEGIKDLGMVLIALFLASYAVGVAAILLPTSWLWTLVGMGSTLAAIFTGYGFIKSGAPGLLWQAAVAAHHGICPPVEIIRR